MFNPKKDPPGKLYGIRRKSETIEVSAYKAKTFINQANKPTVSKFKGRNNNFKSGTKIKFISIKAKAPMARLLKPPV